MQVYRSVVDDELSARRGLDLFLLIESFLVRRAVCGVEPTGLHAVFKDLWGKVGPEPKPEIVAKAIQESTTVFWPEDSAFSDSLRSRSIYGSRVTPFLLVEYNASLGGDVPMDGIVIEHILPQKPKVGDYADFSAEQRSVLVHTFANLLPLSKSMNPGLGNASFEDKREAYQRDSMFKSVREFSKSYKVWNPKMMEERADVLISWALKRWPLPE